MRVVGQQRRRIEPPADDHSDDDKQPVPHDIPVTDKATDPDTTAHHREASIRRDEMTNGAPICGWAVHRASVEIYGMETVDAAKFVNDEAGRVPKSQKVKSGGTTMKTMTCRQFGGPCDLAHRGETADDVIKAQDQHLKDAEKAGDATHFAARQEMKRRWRHPKKSMGWYRDMKQAFAELPVG